MVYTILVFDDRSENIQTLAPAIRHKFGYRTVTANTIDYGIRLLMSGSQPRPDLVLIDFTNGSADTLQIIRQVKTCKPQLPVIAMMQYGSDDYAIPIITAGANDFLSKPVGIERLKLSIHNALKMQNLSNAIARLESKNTGHISFSDLVGQSEAFKNTLLIAEKAAGSDMPVWINGEQGSGREALARAIHGSSRRAGKPFISLNCQNLNTENAEAILCGYAESASSPKARTGFLLAANHGTVYLNEITCLPVIAQHRLMDALSYQSTIPLGSSTAVPLDIRIICSNSRNADSALRRGTLSNVLQEKLQAIVIANPPLRNRRMDIARLAQHFLNLYAATENRFPPLLCDDAIQSLENNPWPGNIRQLSNLLHRAALLSQLDQVDAATLRLVQQLEPIHYGMHQLFTVEEGGFFDRKGQVKNLRSIENDAIRLALRHSNGCMTKAAKILGIGRSTLYRKIDGLEGVYMPRENHTTRPMTPASSGELS